ncbi:MAG: pyridoxine 5'-phosphate synthase [Rhodobacteraceae bacterium]|nr:pyridoxine 5'-phosphate synthase [Paracoccaceae bacterium]
MPARAIRLGVNIDHVATVRNARGGGYPSPLRAAKLAERAGADGITAHLREDRRHISDEDVAALMQELSVPLNLEMAMTAEMQQIALQHAPHAVCIVPERREERTTEAGLDVVGIELELRNFIPPLKKAGCRVSLFVGADPDQIDAAVRVGAAVVELHTGSYCDAWHDGRVLECRTELERLTKAAAYAENCGLEVHAGHGLSYETVGPIAKLPQIAELNIGHFLVGESIFVGLTEAIGRMRELMTDASEPPTAQ